MKIGQRKYAIIEVQPETLNAVDMNVISEQRSIKEGRKNYIMTASLELLC